MTEREAFEAWWPSLGQTIGRIAAIQAWEAACAWQREQDTVICENISAEAWTAYKRGEGPERANPHTEGVSDGASRCAEDIRRQGEKECL